MGEEMKCSACHFKGSDVLISNCGCTVHARCVPLRLISSESGDPSAPHDRELVPNNPGTVLCPFCQSNVVSSVQLLPMSIDKLDRAVEIRKKGSKDKSNSAGFQEIQAQTSYLLLLHNGSQASGGISIDNDYQRTSRWTDEEIAFVDFLLDAFDKGRLPLPQGVRLNDFLCEMLLCKASRLTKKMKNARLSVRSYDIKNRTRDFQSLDCEMFSTLEEKFLQSISSEATRLELRFNIVKSWRSHFSNFCLQIGCKMLEASEWIASLENMERRATEAEEIIRKARRRRMGMALKTDVRSSNPGVFFGGIPMKRQKVDHDGSKTAEADGKSSNEPLRVLSSDTVANEDRKSNTYPRSLSLDTESRAREPPVRRPRQDSSSIHSVSDGDGSETGSEADFISNMLNVSAHHPSHSALMEEFAMVFNESEQPMNNRVLGGSKSFMEEITSFLETNKLPFEHVDVWVPSYESQGSDPQSLRLFHAGHGTRSDLDPMRYCQLQEYGDYSTRFSFAPGVGLPGRVYQSGRPSWESGLDQADPTSFERAGGAKIYEVRTGFGIPVTTSVIGCIVLCLYGRENIPEQPDIAVSLSDHLCAYTLEPKWKLVVEIASSGNSKPIGDTKLGALMHFNHAEESDGMSMGTSGNPMSMESRSASSAEHSGFAAATVDPHDEDQRIAAILGDHMPLNEIPVSGSENMHSTYASTLLAPAFMSLRLLLLRAPDRRSSEDNELLDIVRKSFRGYSKDSRRTDKDLAYLVVKDWQFLKANAVQASESTSANSQPTPCVAQDYNQRAPAPSTSSDGSMSESHKCHLMEAPVSTYSLSGVPPKMPSALSYLDPSQFTGKSGRADDGNMKKRKVEEDESRLDHTVHDFSHFVGDS